MSAKTIPAEVKQQADELVENFNRTRLKGRRRYYVTRYRGSYLYLDRIDSGRLSRICRLKYTGEMDEWEFAIFKYSDERYDPEEWLFPGDGHVDGTIEGAMKAGLEAYP